MTIDPREAAIVVRIFTAFAGGRSESIIVRELNASAVSGRRRSSKGWPPATVHRVLRNEKYVGRWVWNKSETRRDPRTGRRRQFAKRESDWSVTRDETLRIVPADLAVLMGSTRPAALRRGRRIGAFQMRRLANARPEPVLR